LCEVKGKGEIMSPAKLDRCVKKVKAKGAKGNPWAICKAALKKKK